MLDLTKESVAGGVGGGGVRSERMSLLEEIEADLRSSEWGCSSEQLADRDDTEAAVSSPGKSI